MTVCAESCPEGTGKQKMPFKALSVSGVPYVKQGTFVMFQLTILTERYQINSGRKPQDKGYDFCFGFSLRNRSATGAQLFA